MVITTVLREPCCVRPSAEEISKQPYHCANGAYHDYMCCPTCWNHHPDFKGRDYRFVEGTTYPFGSLGLSESEYAVVDEAAQVGNMLVAASIFQAEKK